MLLLALFTFAGGLTAALAIYFWHQGDSDIVFEVKDAHAFQVKHEPFNREIYCRCLIPLTNRGRQHGMVVNVFCQPMYCGKVMEKLEIVPRLRLCREPLRQNGYWEAVIIKKNTTHLAELEVKIRARIDLSSLVREVPRLTMLIFYQTVGRNGMQLRLAEIQFDLTGEKAEEKVGSPCPLR